VFCIVQMENRPVQVADLSAVTPNPCTHTPGDHRPPLFQLTSIMKIYIVGMQAVRG